MSLVRGKNGDPQSSRESLVDTNAAEAGKIRGPGSTVSIPLFPQPSPLLPVPLPANWAEPTIWIIMS